MERLKYFMKEKDIRLDIIDSALDSYGIDNMITGYKKAVILNKLINKEIGKNIISSYKRTSNILDMELKNKEIELSSVPDPGLFKNDIEIKLYKKIKDLKKYFINTNKDENHIESLNTLADAKSIIFEFFDNVKVNDDNIDIKKNRLELLQMICKTFDNYLNFSKIESL